MAKVRLTQAARTRLISLSHELVQCSAEQTAVDAAYKKAAPLVRKAVEAKYPPRDMRILVKYEKAAIDDCIKLQLTAGGVNMFCFAEGKGPLAAETTYNGTVYQADEEMTSAFAEWKAATEALDAARSQKLGDYKALINSARTLEDVTEIWPEAEQIRSSLRSTALTVLTPAVIERIKADVATRAQPESA